MRSTGWSPDRPLLPVPAPPSAISAAFATMAQRLDPDAPPPGQAVVLTIWYDGTADEPPEQGASYVLYLPAKAPSVEAWASSPLVAGFRAQIAQPGDGAS
jgi:hypothetical protein